MNHVITVTYLCIPAHFALQKLQNATTCSRCSFSLLGRRRNGREHFFAPFHSRIGFYCIKKSKDLFVPADKTTNFYKMDPNSYNELLHKNVIKTYKKIPAKVVHNIQNEAKGIAEKLNLADRINTTAQREAFITLKDHKPNFQNNPSCHLINPSKSEIGKISKNILDRVNKKII